MKQALWPVKGAPSLGDQDVVPGEGAPSLGDQDVVPGEGARLDVVPGEGAGLDAVPGEGARLDVVPGEGARLDEAGVVPGEGADCSLGDQGCEGAGVGEEASQRKVKIQPLPTGQHGISKRMKEQHLCTIHACMHEGIVRSSCMTSHAVSGRHLMHAWLGHALAPCTLELFT